MTSLGHTLVGASIGMMCLPAMHRARNRILFTMGIIVVASLPDWPVPGWGHFRLDISHSIIVNGGLMLCIAIVLRSMTGSVFRKYKPVLIGVVAAWLSHFLLDALYADSRLAVFWPISDASISLPIPWLKTMPHVPPPFDRQILMIFIFEALTFLPLLVLTAAWRGSGRTIRA